MNLKLHLVPLLLSILLVPSLAPSADWEVEIGKGLTARPEVLGERVFVLSTDGWAVFLQLETGETIWKRRSGHSLNLPPLVIGSVAYIASQGNKQFVGAVSMHSGETLWEEETGSLRAGPVKAGDGLAVLEAGGLIRYYGISPPGLEWSVATTPPCVDRIDVRGGKLFTACADTIFVIDTETGTILSSLQLAQIETFCPAGDGGSVIAVLRGGEVVHVRIPSGERLWSKLPAPATLNHITVRDDLILLSADSRLTALSVPTGDILWSNQLAAPVSGPADVAGEYAAAATIDGGVYVFDLSSGRPLLRHDLETPIASSPVLCPDRVLVGTQLGKLFSFPFERSGKGGSR